MAKCKNMADKNGNSSGSTSCSTIYDENLQYNSRILVTKKADNMKVESNENISNMKTIN